MCRWSGRQSHPARRSEDLAIVRIGTKPLKVLRSHCDLPLAVGFGIKDAESASAVAGVADGVVIGSALVSGLAVAGDSAQACKAAAAFLAPVREGMDNSTP